MIFLLFLLMLFPRVVLAQDKTSEENYQDLLMNYRVYQGLIDPFNSQKSKYRTYQTVGTQAELLSSSKNLILAEVDSMISYAVFIKSLLAEATKVLNYKENYLYVMLDEELAYLSPLKKNVLNLSSFEETNTAVSDLKTHYQKISNFGYQAKSDIEMAGATKTLENVKIETEKIKNLLSSRSSDDPRSLAAREKLSSLEKEIKTAEGFLNQASGILKNLGKESDHIGSSQQIRSLIDKSIERFTLVVNGEKDILFSLR